MLFPVKPEGFLVHPRIQEQGVGSAREFRLRGPFGDGLQWQGGE